MALENNSIGFSDALVVLGCAGIVIPTFARFRINPVIGFILVGLVVGPYGLGSFVDRWPWLYHITITDPDSIEPFAELGIVLLLFSIGLELSFRRLWSMRRMVFGLGAAELALSGLIIGTGLALLGQPVAGAFGLGIALALSSTALVLPMAGTQSPVGRPAFAMLLFEDLALVPIIFTLGALAPYAAQDGWDGLWTTIWQGTLLIVGMFFGGRLLLPRLFAQAARTKSPELFLAASLLVVILASIATSAVGLSPIVGALLAGLLIAETQYHGEVEAITAPFKGLALGVFLLTVGMHLDLRAIAGDWAELAVAVVGVVLVKVLVTGFLLRMAGNRRGVSTETALLMASPSETTLIVLAAAQAAQLIQPSTAAFWQTVTALGLTLTPVLARVGRDVAQRVERREAIVVPEETGDRPRAVIVGFGRVGRLVAEMMQAHDRPFVAIDADIDTVAEARRAGFPVIFGDVSRPGVIDRLRLEGAGALVLTMDDRLQIARLVRTVRAQHAALPIVARAKDSAHAAELYLAGATDAIPETLESSLQLSEAALVDLGVAVGPVIASIHDKRAEFRAEIMREAQLEREPRLRRVKMEG